MTAGDGEAPSEGARAADALQARLEPARMHRLKRVGLYAASLVITALSGSAPDDLVSRVDLVVARRDTGGEVLRVRAGALTEGDRLLAQTRRDMATMTVEQFVRQWRIFDS